MDGRVRSAEQKLVELATQMKMLEQDGETTWKAIDAMRDLLVDIREKQVLILHRLDEGAKTFDVHAGEIEKLQGDINVLKTGAAVGAAQKAAYFAIGGIAWAIAWPVMQWIASAVWKLR